MNRKKSLKKNITKAVAINEELKSPDDLWFLNVKKGKKGWIIIVTACHRIP